VPADRIDDRHSAFVLTRQVASRDIVVRRCAVARAAGIAEGIDLTHARSLVPPRVSFHTQAHRPDRDAAALHALACWALRFAPLVAPDPPDGLMIDISGTQRLHRGEKRLLRAIASGIHRLGFGIRIAAASTFASAWAVSRFGEYPLARVDPGREAQAIEPLPTAALRIDEQTMHGLTQIGITRVGHLLDLPRASLAARFDLALVHRLHQALGNTHEHIEPVRPTPPARSELLFDGPTDRFESIHAAARHVLENLTAQLAKRERGIHRLDLEVLRPRAAPERIHISLSRPSRSTRHLWSLLRAQLDRVDLGEGVEGLALTASRTARLRHEQIHSRALGAGDEQIVPAAWGELVDTLVARLGPDNIVRIDPVESHLPGRAFRERSVMQPPPRDLASVAIVPADRPTTLFSRPEPADTMALTPDGPILSLGWRARRWNIVSCSRPERIGPEWWRNHPAASHPDRDYFAVQTESGRWLWICRLLGTARWFVHGEWT